jgi:hypothetical protein
MSSTRHEAGIEDQRNATKFVEKSRRKWKDDMDIIL